MIKFTEIFISLFLIVIIFIHIPEENIGLSSFTTKDSVLGSPSSARRFLNILTFICILIYFLLAIKLNRIIT